MVGSDAVVSANEPYDPLLWLAGRPALVGKFLKNPVLSPHARGSRPAPYR